MAIGECAPGERLAGYGAVWQYCHPVSGNFLTVLGLKDVTGPKMSQDPLETTSQDGDGFETWIPNGIKRIDDTSITGDFLMEQYTTVADMFRDGTITRWRRVLTQTVDNEYVEFCAFILDFEDTHPLKDLSTFTFTLKPSGEPEFGQLS